MCRAALVLIPILLQPAIVSAELRLYVLDVDNWDLLTGYVTQDLELLTTTDWLSAQLMVTLEQPGKIYQDPLGRANPQSPDPNFLWPWTWQYDTFVSSGFLGETVSLTGAWALGGDPTMWTFDEDAISIGWSTADTDDIGTLWLARITLADEANGTWVFLATAAPLGGPLLLASGPVVDGYMVPEPVTAALLGFGFVALSLIRRKHTSDLV